MLHTYWYGNIPPETEAVAVPLQASKQVPSVPEINSSNFRMRSFAERIAVNTPLQGTAADIIKIAMNNIHLKLLSMKSKMVLQVHDELLFDVSSDELDKVVPMIKNEMENVVSLKVPITVNIKKGKDWLNMEEIV